MTMPTQIRHTNHWLPPLLLLAGVYACSSSTASNVDNGKPGGSACTTDTDCVSKVCMNGVCEGNGQGAPANSQCTANAQCASLNCSPTTGTCNAGTQLAAGQSCASSSECQTGLACLQGVCSTPSSNAGGAGSTSASGGSGYAGSTSTGTPPFLGDPTYAPLTPGCGPDTAHSCGACSHPGGVGTTATVLRAPAFLCFTADTSKGVADPTPNDPAAIIEQVSETLNGISYVHIRITFDPAFADNTFGANASAGWFQTMNGKTGKGHTFSNDLTASDHLDLLLTDGAGNKVMELGEDYITSLTATGPGPGGPKATGGSAGIGTGTSTGGVSGSGGSSGTGVAACGYQTLGVLGGDGYMTTGSASHVLAAATSIDRNVTGCGYCTSAACDGNDAGANNCTVNSPKTDDAYTPNSLTPNWNYDVVYEVWIDLAAFGSAGFGQAYVEYVHASPSKIGANTLYVSPTPCPPNIGHCAAGQDCWVGPGPDGGTSVCEQNYQLYVTLEGASICTPIPYANYPNHDACPTGYVLDTASEGRYCLPSI